MKEIKLLVNRFGFTTEFTGNIPERWEEVTEPQLLAIAEMYLQKSTQTAMLAKLTGLAERHIKHLSDFQIYALLEDLDFLTDYRPRNCFIILSVGKLFSPQHKLDALTWEQFIYVDTYFHDFMGEENDENLNKFIAHLYLRKNEVFDHSLCLVRAKSKIITSMPHTTKTAIMINYRLIYEWLCSIYPLIFHKTTINKEQKTKKFNPGWIRVHEAIVGDDLLNYEKYGKLHLHNVLRFITSKIKENGRR